MKKTIINIMATTGIALVVLATIGTFYGTTVLFFSSVFQTLAVSIIIHFGFFVTRKFESRYAALEVTLDIAYTVAVLLIAGALFGWYSSTPVGILILMAVLIYGILLFLSMLDMRENVADINQLLQKRNHKSKGE